MLLCQVRLVSRVLAHWCMSCVMLNILPAHMYFPWPASWASSCFGTTEVLLALGLALVTNCMYIGPSCSDQGLSEDGQPCMIV